MQNFNVLITKTLSNTVQNGLQKFASAPGGIIAAQQKAVSQAPSLIQGHIPYDILALSKSPEVNIQALFGNELMQYMQESLSQYTKKNGWLYPASSRQTINGVRNTFQTKVDLCTLLSLPKEELIKMIRSQKCTDETRDTLYIGIRELDNIFDKFLKEKTGIDIKRVSDIGEKERQIIDDYATMAKSALLKYLETFEDLLFPKSSDPKVIKLEEQLTKLGLNDVRLTNHLEEGELLLESCKKMKRQGIDRFPKVRFQVDTGFKRLAPNNTISMSTPEKSLITFTDELRNTSGYSNDFLAVKSPQGIIFHEVGHAENQIPFSKQIAQKYFEASKNLIQSEVSGYAATDPSEFCAEVFSGIMSGKTYPKEIMEIYKHYKGVVPRGIAVN